MDSHINNFWDVILWSFWFFIWIAAIMVWFRCVFDMFSDSTLSGWAKAGWALVLIFLPWLGALIYLIVRGRSMTDRQMAAVAKQRSEQEEYIQQVAGREGHPGYPDRRRQVTARLRRHRRVGVQRPQGKGHGLTGSHLPGLHRTC